MRTEIRAAQLRPGLRFAGLALAILLLPNSAFAQEPCGWWGSIYFRYDASQRLSRHVTLARIVADTADLVARENSGVYQDLASVQSYLPGGRLLDNPTTEDSTEPSTDQPASPGRVGYYQFDSGANWNDLASISIYTTATDLQLGTLRWWRSASPSDRERVSSYMGQ